VKFRPSTYGRSEGSGFAWTSTRQRRRWEPTIAELADLLAAVLVDPNLHTDLRMRLHREIRVVLARAHGSSSG
jgi:hypothetical protein